MDVTDRVAIVTGASSGIGAATARTLAAAGCAVTLAARREDRLRAVADDIDHDRTLVHPTDVTDEDAVHALVDRTLETFGGLDILVNNAGIARGGGFTDREGDTEYATVIDVNLLGAMHTTEAAMPPLRASELGDVVVVSSLNARHPADHVSGYTASKFGVNGFARALRKELSDDDVRVTIVMPGPVVTEMAAWEDWDGRPLAAADVAETIAFTVTQPAHVEIGEIAVNSTDKFD